MAKPQDSYRALLGKIKALGEQQYQSFGEQIRCRQGCYACCHPPDSLFRVEAEALGAVVADLDEASTTLVASQLKAYEAGKRALCPLLDEGRGGACLAYEGRPAICRTQGFALWLRHDEEEVERTGEEGALNWCELNFTEQQPERPDAFDVERLNVMMSLITQIGWPGEDPRISLVALLREALSTSRPDATEEPNP